MELSGALSLPQGATVRPVRAATQPRHMLLLVPFLQLTCFFAGFLVHFPRPFAFDATDLSKSLGDRVAPSDWFIAMAVVGVVLCMPRRLGAAVPWLVLVPLMCLSTLLSESGSWTVASIEMAAVLCGSIWTAALFEPRVREAFEKGFVAGLIVLLVILYFDMAMIGLGRPRLYASPVALRGPFYLQSQLGHHLAACVCLLLAFNHAQSAVPRRLLRACLLATFLPVVLSGSRSSLIGVTFAFTLLAIAGSRKTRIRVAVTGVTLFAAAAVMLLIRSDYTSWVLGRWEAAEGLGSKGQSFFTIQLNYGTQAFLEHPLLGIGKGGFAKSEFAPLLAGEYHEIHNTYLASLVETGLVGFTALLVAFIATGRRAMRQLRHKSVAIAAPAAFFFGLLIMGLHGIVLRERGFWLVVGYVSLNAAAVRSVRLRIPARRSPGVVHAA